MVGEWGGIRFQFVARHDQKPGEHPHPAPKRLIVGRLRDVRLGHRAVEAHRPRPGRAATNPISQLSSPDAATDLRSYKADGMARNGWTACRNHWTTSSEYARLRPSSSPGWRRLPPHGRHPRPPIL